MARPPASLLKLMRFAPIKGRLKIGPEDSMCMIHGVNLRAWALEGRLQGVFTHPANELCFGHKTPLKVAIAKHMGLIGGAADYLHLKSDGSLAMEAKAPDNGKQSDNQKYFQEWCEAQGVPYRLFTTPQEGKSILMEHGFLK